MDTNKVEFANDLKLVNDPSGISNYDPCYVISKKIDGEDIRIAFIFQDKYGKHIRTLGENLQTYIVTYEDYQNFIKLADEAFLRLKYF